ncbi:MAG: oligosaccharide flippase family protein [Bacteroidota bacterium]|nr:oligosaccharide flippase family protein [Candidatus Kapabacteria bacterium]MCS7302896.1 oligosaccharide flippase family protein [Candidatus Kapabacteria bacterium]MCX7937650.1 oligosaccharide flippase family protein [Chlorobiota bacterium]MDW8075110.1 oligosaccharide flippase family protein [Bacteroidota bacterium]MDW8272001.1 oligosaccharide flippase family protein [Bacteroidota bacterium]
MPRIQDHLPKLSWIAADKLLFVLYGVLALFQIRALPPEEYGLYALLVSIQTWIFVLADGLVLQGLVQFGAERSQRAVLDATVAVLYGSAIAGLVGGIVSLQPLLSRVFDEPRFAQVAQLEMVFCAVTIPRTFCLRLLQRDIQPRPIFWINAVWLGSMGAATVHGVATGWLRSFETLAGIAIGGMALSSLAAVWLCRGLLRWSIPRRTIAQRVLQFGLRQMSTGAIYTSIRQLDVAIAQTFFGTAMVGTYQAAKTIFRLFELGVDAAASVVYPAAVAFHHTADRQSLHQVLSKAISVVFVGSAIATLAIWAMGDLLASVLGQRYATATDFLRLLSLGACFMPLGLAGVVLVAAGREGIHARIVATAAVVALMCYGGFGSAGWTVLFPLGTVAFYAVVGLGDWWVLRREGIVRLRAGDLWRSVPDAWAFIQRLMR